MVLIFNLFVTGSEEWVVTVMIGQGNKQKASSI